MWRSSFSSNAAHLIGFLGDIPTNIVCANPVYRFGEAYAIGNLVGCSVLGGKDKVWIDGLIVRRSMTRLEEGSPIEIHEDISVVVVSDRGSSLFTDAIPGWEDRLGYKPVEGRPARWITLPCEEAKDYLGNMSHRMSQEMDRLLRTANGDGTVEKRVETMGWAIWEGLSLSDEKHRRQIMVRIVAARRMCVNLPVGQFEALRRMAAKSVFLSVTDEVKRKGFGLEEQLRQLDELVDRYIERLRNTPSEP